MYLLKKTAFAAIAVVFGLGVFVSTSNAQYRTRTWTTQNRTIYVQPGTRTRSWQYRSYDRGRVTPQEYRRLQRERYRIQRSSMRAYRDGYVSPREQRRLARQYNRYNRTAYRVRRY